nr:hypothetical protein [Tanacetum cinerariifolium]
MKYKDQHGLALRHVQVLAFSGCKNIPQLEWTPSRLLSLMLVKSDDDESREIFFLSNKSIRKIRLPEAYGKVCRSSCGWLLTFGKDFASQLINLLSREIINLPRVDPFPKSMFPFGWDEIIRKVVLVMELILVVVIWGNCKLGFCHVGDNKWTSIETMASIRDITVGFLQLLTIKDNEYATKNIKHV